LLQINNINNSTVKAHWLFKFAELPQCFVQND